MGNQAFGNLLRDIREQQGISMRALAKSADMDPAYLSRIENGKTGLLFEPGNADDLSSVIHRLITDTALRESLGKYGREWVASNLNPDRYAAQVERFYEQVLRSGKLDR